LVSALPLVFSVGADHDSVTLSAVAALEELELLASLTEPPLSVEPPHPARIIEITNALGVWARIPRLRSSFMCTRLANR
jgi:hypothetical protein